MTTEITVSNILTEAEICTRFNVTTELLDKASRVLDCVSGKVFYQVKSQTTDDIYEVRWNSEFKRLTCNCKAGMVGIPCWHKRAAMAASRLDLQAERIANAREQAEQERELAAKREAQYYTDEASGKWTQVDAEIEAILRW